MTIHPLHCAVSDVDQQSAVHYAVMVLRLTLLTLDVRGDVWISEPVQTTDNG